MHVTLTSHDQERPRVIYDTIIMLTPLDLHRGKLSNYIHLTGPLLRPVKSTALYPSTIELKSSLVLSIISPVIRLIQSTVHIWICTRYISAHCSCQASLLSLALISKVQSLSIFYVDCCIMTVSSLITGHMMLTNLLIKTRFTLLDVDPANVIMSWIRTTDCKLIFEYDITVNGI